MTESDPTPKPTDETPPATPATPETTTEPAAAAPAEAPAPTPPTAAKSVEKPAAKPAAKPTSRPAPPDGNWWWGTGRRKTAVARVRIRPGDGKFIVNSRPYDEFFPRERDRKDLLNVLERTKTRGTVDVHVNVGGGGITGQAGAIVLGLGRALGRFDPNLDSILRSNGFLTRDAREVERKKYGQPGARKRFQFSKR
jgi:small subunit ribosomal protein S9